MEYAAIFQPELDTQTIAGAVSGWMEDNAGQVKYSGGSESPLLIKLSDKIELEYEDFVSTDYLTGLKQGTKLALLRV